MTHIYSSTDHSACANDCHVTVERTQQDYHTALFIGEGKRLTVYCAIILYRGGGCLWRGGAQESGR